MKGFYRIIAVVCLGWLICLTSCDWEKLTGYDFSGDIPDDQIQISGTVFNAFTGETVNRAVVQIGELVDSTDLDGHFQFDYALSGSEIRNKPITVEISHNKYDTFRDTLILTLSNFVMDVELIYVFPIVGLPAKAGIDGIRVDVTDYQGVENLKSVTGRFFIEELALNESIQRSPIHIREFTRIKKLSEVQGEYFTQVPVSWFPTDPFSKNSVTVIAEDWEGHVDSFRVRLGDIF